MEVMIAIAIMVVMMTIAWRTIASTSEARNGYEHYEERNHELRMAMGRMVGDFESAYLSHNEDINAAHPRTMMIVKATGKIPDVRFSTLNHRVLWSDANECDETVIQYLAHSNPDHPGQTDLVRREQRRLSNEVPEEEPADYDVLVRDIESLKIELWNWRNLEWQDTWDTTQSDGQRGQLPLRVRITITVKGYDDRDIKLVTEARVWMQEALNFSPT
jgi:type II secretory pathway component PulJ